MVTAGEQETSEILAIRPDLVRLDRASTDGEGLPLDRLEGVERDAAFTPASGGTPIIPRTIAAMADRRRPRRAIGCWTRTRRLWREIVATIKRDEMTPQLQREFYAAGERPW